MATKASLFDRWARFVHGLGPSAGRGLVEILVKHLEVDAEGVALVKSMLVGELSHKDATAKMAEVEHRGDDLRTALVDALARALVTPIDREDLYRLSRAIDSVLDGLRDFTREWDVFHARDPSGLLKVLDAISEAVGDTRAAVLSITKTPDVTSPQVLKAQHSSNRVRRVHEDEIAILFEGHLTMRVLRQRELLHRLDAIGLHLVGGVQILADAFVKRGE